MAARKNKLAGWCALALAAACHRDEPPPPAASAASAVAAPSASAFMLGRGTVSVQGESIAPSPEAVQYIQPGVASGARSCYVEALRQNAEQRGSIRFSMKAPPKEGAFLISLETEGALAPELVACVRGVFGTWYHYEGKPAVVYSGTLDFQPSFERVPAPPSEALVRRIIEGRYAKDGVVKVTKFALRAVRHRLSSPDLIRDYDYEVELEFVVPGYEATCVHRSSYKIFSRTPHESRAAGHSCTNSQRDAGARTSVQSSVYFRQLMTGWALGYDEERYCGDGICD